MSTTIQQIIDETLTEFRDQLTQFQDVDRQKFEMALRTLTESRIAAISYLSDDEAETAERTGQFALSTLRSIGARYALDAQAIGRNFVRRAIDTLLTRSLDLLIQAAR